MLLVSPLAGTKHVNNQRNPTKSKQSVIIFLLSGFGPLCDRIHILERNIRNNSGKIKENMLSLKIFIN